jgi:hypothetical protein
MLRQDIGSDIHLDFSTLILGRLRAFLFFKKIRREKSSVLNLR